VEVDKLGTKPGDKPNDVNEPAEADEAEKVGLGSTFNNDNIYSNFV
jgi:hypothetical protein